MSAASITRADQDRLPNVIFILVDTLRADHVGAYGYARKLTPTMDKIAEAGVLFEHCQAAAPWTVPSVASMLTSYYPTVHGAVDFSSIDNASRGVMSGTITTLSEDYDTLAEVMKQRGYQTAGFCANKFITKKFGFAQGYDHYDTSQTANSIRGTLINSAALQWIRQERAEDKPLFLYLHYMDVHGPYNALPEFWEPLAKEIEQIPADQRTPLTKKEFMRINGYIRQPVVYDGDVQNQQRYQLLAGYRDYWVARYDAGIAEMDQYLSELIAELDKQGLWEDSLVVLAADHGEALNEHGLWEHGYSHFQTDQHVPLMIRWPKHLPAGRRVGGNVSLIDVMPTLVDLLDAGDTDVLQGESLVPAIENGAASSNRLIIAEAQKMWPSTSPQRHEAAYEGPWKLMRRSIPPGAKYRGRTIPAGEELLLFNLEDDPGETTNLAPRDTARASQLKQQLMDQVAANANVKPGVVTSVVQVDPETMRTVKAVGYAGGDEDPNDKTHDGVLPEGLGDDQPTSKPAADD